jgi:thioesterase domain-containing protein
MLVPIQTSGHKPPLFFVHGRPGIMPVGPALSRVLGPDQPLYVFHASGIDGRGPVIDNVPEMVRTYITDIYRFCPTGPLVIGGMCDGTFGAMEIAQELKKRGRQVGPLILTSPTLFPGGFFRENQTLDPSEPLLAGQLYRQVRRSLLDHANYSSNELPFDPSDSKQLHAATLAGVGCLVAFAKHAPTPFAGASQLIVAAPRAFAFFHPNMPWLMLLPGLRTCYVLPWDHMEMFRAGLQTVARLIKRFLEDEPMVEIRPKHVMASATAGR